MARSIKARLGGSGWRGSTAFISLHMKSSPLGKFAIPKNWLATLGLSPVSEAPDARPSRAQKIREHS